MDSLLAELSAQDEIQIQYTRSSYNRGSSYNSNNNNKNSTNSNRNSRISSPSYPPPRNSTRRPTTKSCSLCKAAGRSHQGHDIADCWYLSRSEKLQIAKTLQVTVDEASEEAGVEDILRLIANENGLNIDSGATADGTIMENPADPSVNSPDAVIQKVECDTSPFFYAFYEHHTCHIVLDSGAMSSVVFRRFLQAVGHSMNSTLHSARGADKAPLDVQGEVHLTVQFNGIILTLTALVLDKLD